MDEEKQPLVDNGAAPATRSPMVELFLVAALFCVFAGITVAVTWKYRTVRAKRPIPNPVVITPSPDDVPTYVPEFSLIDKNGEPVTLADLKGHVWVANFFFTSCPTGQCPAMNSRMAKIQRALPERADAKLVSITVDPSNDSPAVLTEYAKTFHARDDRWIFLTGDKEAIIRLSKEGFKLPAGEDPNDHSLRLALVDRDGRIRGYYNSTDDKSVAELQERLNELLKAD
jgi:protein SCO1/2